MNDSPKLKNVILWTRITFDTKIGFVNNYIKVESFRKLKTVPNRHALMLQKKHPIGF